MKQKFRLWIVTGIIMCLITGLFAGCGKAGNKEKSVNGDLHSENKESDAKNSSAEETEGYPDYLNLDGYRPIVKDGENVTLKIAVQRDVVAKDDINEGWFVQFIEKKLNIHLEIEELTSENVEERKNLMLASDNMPDMIFSLGVTNSEIVQYGVEGGMFLPMSDYYSEALTPNIIKTLEEHEDAKQAYTAPDGKMYTLPRFNAAYPGRPDTIGNERVFIDTKYLEAIGRTEAPKTLDDFIEMCRELKALDPAAMGVDEIYPIVSVPFSLENYLMTAFGWVGTDAVAPTWDETEQEIVVPCLQEKYGDYIRVLNTLYSEGLLHPDFYTMDEMEAKALMAERKAPVIGYCAPYVAMKNGWDEFIAASPISSEWSKTPVSVKLAVYAGSKILISADTKYPEVCMRLLDYIYTPEGSVYAERGPAEGSEDTMGIVNGFVLNKEGTTIEYKEVASGEYASLYEYIVNKIRMASCVNDNQNYVELHTLEMLGVKNPQFRSLDLTNPDDHYRYLVYTAQNPYLVSPLPDTYMSVEQSNEYTDLKTVLSDYVSAETAKFVVGQRPLTEIDQFLGELKSMNGDKFLELCKEIYAGYVRK